MLTCRELEDQNVAAMLSSEELRREEELKKQEVDVVTSQMLMRTYVHTVKSP